jgi:hypothetical protein
MTNLKFKNGSFSPSYFYFSFISVHELERGERRLLENNTNKESS